MPKTDTSKIMLIKTYICTCHLAPNYTKINFCMLNLGFFLGIRFELLRWTISAEIPLSLKQQELEWSHALSSSPYGLRNACGTSKPPKRRQGAERRSKTNLHQQNEILWTSMLQQATPYPEFLGCLSKPPEGFIAPIGNSNAPLTLFKGI